MAREIITLQAGQCGNQIGHEFWKTLCKEHAIESNGTGIVSDFEHHNDKKDVFFYQADENRYVPRALLFDLEPRVINEIKESSHKDLFYPENILLSQEGGGAGNNWAQGYDNANLIKEHMFEMLDREAESSDSLEGFMLIHSIIGGTGSGLGSFLLENIRDKFPKKFIKTYTIFPNKHNADVVVQPYNALLSIKRLVEYSDVVIAMDNHALEKIVHNTLRIEDTRFDVTNRLVSTVMSTATAPTRFPGYLDQDLVSIFSFLTPFPRCHFLSTSYSPFVRTEIQHNFKSNNQNTSVSEIIRRLMNSKSKMISSSNSSENYFLSMINIFQGNVNGDEAIDAFNKMKQLNKIQFTQLYQEPNHLIYAQRSSHIPYTNNISGLNISNNTNFVSVLKNIISSFKSLRSKKAYLDGYKKTSFSDTIYQEFEESLVVAEDVIKEYEQIQSPEFLSSIISEELE